jgi:hypothetical protein
MTNLTRRTGWRALAVTAGASLALLAAACGDDDSSSSDSAPTTAAAQATTAPSAASTAAAGTDAKLAGVKSYLTDQTGQLVAFTEQFKADAEQYYTLAQGAGDDPSALWAKDAATTGPLVEKLKQSWVDGNPLYERMEGIVAGVPSLSQYDVIIDAGSSVQDDPESAVPFDLTLPDGSVVKQPGAFYNITEGALWGTLPDYQPQSTPVDLDGDGTTAFGEVLPDPAFLVTAAREFDRYARELQTAAVAWQPSESDAFTALVVMVPTMSEYFGQWKESRFVLGDDATGENFNVVSRLSDIHDILASLQVVYADVEPVVAAKDATQAQQTASELDGLQAFIEDLWAKEQDGKRFTPDEAEVLGNEAQTRGAAIAGQVSQAASSLGISVVE